MSLVVPGSSERMLAKAQALDTDEVVIDLEDAVVPDRKPEALEAVTAALKEPFAARRVLVRVNPVGSPWAHVELVTLSKAGTALHGIVVPKVETAGDLAFVGRLLDGAELAAGQSRRLTVQALIETASGLEALAEITAATDRLEALILGYADLGVSLGRSPVGAADLDRWLAVQDRVLVAARAAGLKAIDGPFLGIDDADGLVRSAARAAALGFDDKWAIHPSQLPPIVEALRPTEAEVDHARRVLGALADAARHGGGAVALDGEMLDEPVRLAALRTLERAGEAE